MQPRSTPKIASRIALLVGAAALVASALWQAPALSGAPQTLCDVQAGGGMGHTTTPYPATNATQVVPGKVTFGGAVSLSSQGVPGGQAQYADHNSGDPFSFKSVTVYSVVCSDIAGGKHAIITGQGRVTKLTAFDDLQENFTIEVDDLATPGAGKDTYRLNITGSLFNYDSGKITLEGGNIQIQ